MKIRYSVIGTSWITRAFISGAALVDELELLGVYSRTKERALQFAKEEGAAEIYTDLGELAAGDSDFIYIASPNLCHYEQSKFLLEHGKNVICEKPVTVTAEEYRELRSLAEEKGLVYFEAIMYMHDPDRQKLREAVGRLGNICSARIDYSQLSSKYPALMRGENPNIFNPAMKTGALNDLGIYCVYPVVDLFGMPRKITPAVHRLFTGADGTGAAFFRYDDKLVTVTYSKTAQSRVGSEITGDLGTVTIGSISMLEDVFFYNNDGEKEVIIGKKEKSELMKNEALTMVRLINDKNAREEFYGSFGKMNENVLTCMEMMRNDTE